MPGKSTLLIQLSDSALWRCKPHSYSLREPVSSQVAKASLEVKCQEVVRIPQTKQQKCLECKLAGLTHYQRG
jgi:hypothetical protein